MFEKLLNCTKMKTLIILVFTVILTNSIFSQNKHLIYSSTLDNTLIADKSHSNVRLNLEENIFHLLIINNKNSITYYERPELQIIDSLGNIILEEGEVKLFNKPKHEFTTSNYIQNFKKDTFYLNFTPKTWIKIDNSHLKSKYDNVEKEIKYLQTTNQDISFNKDLHSEYIMKFTTGLNTKEINGFLCKEGVLNVTDIESYHVWFTEEINYNWCFDDFRAIIPGTIVQLTKNETKETVFELKKIKELDYSDIKFTKQQISELMKRK